MGWWMFQTIFPLPDHCETVEYLLDNAAKMEALKVKRLDIASDSGTRSTAEESREEVAREGIGRRRCLYTSNDETVKSSLNVEEASVVDLVVVDARRGKSDQG